jgi:DNA-binding transcriptional regulator YdaS (Cro superfamily)
MDDRTPIRLAIEKLGSVKALADAIGVTPQAIAQWKRFPAERLLTIESATGIFRQQLRPDLYQGLKNIAARSDAAA